MMEHSAKHQTRRHKARHRTEVKAAQFESNFRTPGSYFKTARLCLLFCDRLCASWPLQLDPTPCMRQTANLHQQAAWLFCRSHKELGHRRSGSTRTADACNPPMKPTKQKHLAAFVFQFLSPQASRKKTNTSCKPFFHPHLLVLIQSQLWIT